MSDTIYHTLLRTVTAHAPVAHSLLAAHPDVFGAKFHLRWERPTALPIGADGETYSERGFEQHATRLITALDDSYHAILFDNDALCDVDGDIEMTSLRRLVETADGGRSRVIGTTIRARDSHSAVVAEIDVIGSGDSFGVLSPPRIRVQIASDAARVDTIAEAARSNFAEACAIAGERRVFARHHPISESHRLLAELCRHRRWEVAGEAHFDGGCLTFGGVLANFRPTFFVTREAFEGFPAAAAAHGGLPIDYAVFKPIR